MDESPLYFTFNRFYISRQSSFFKSVKRKPRDSSWPTKDHRPTYRSYDAMATITGPLTALHIIYPVSLFVHLVVHHILGRSKTPLAPSKEPLCPKLVSYVRAVFGITYALQLMALFVEIFVTQDCCFACAFACDSGAGMASCFLYLGLISLLPDSIISDRPFQHWHTYLGLGLTVIFEPLVHLGDNFYMRGLHQPVFQAIHLSMAAIRYAPLVCSLAAAVIDRYHRGKMDYVPLDEERECLLPPRSSITGGPRASDMKIRRDYGTVSGTGPASPDVECDPATEIQQIDSKDAGVLQFLKRIIHVRLVLLLAGTSVPFPNIDSKSHRLHNIQSNISEP